MSADNNKAKRLQQVAKELNVGIHTIVEYLGKKGKKIDEKPNTKIDSDMYNLLLKAFQGEKKLKEASKTTKKTTKPVEIVLDATEVVKKEKEEREADEVPTNEIVIRDVTLGKEKVLNKIITKYYEKWSEENFEEEYSAQFTNMYFKINEVLASSTRAATVTSNASNSKAIATLSSICLYASSSAIGIRFCSIVSRSRTVTQLSVSESKS